MINEGLGRISKRATVYGAISAYYGGKKILRISVFC